MPNFKSFRIAAAALSAHAAAAATAAAAIITMVPVTRAVAHFVHSENVTS